MTAVERNSPRAVGARSRGAIDRAGRGEPDEDGFTLIEVVVAVTVMSVFMAIVTAGMLQVFRTANATESRAAAQTQVQIAFHRLDKQVRYAKQITAPAVVESMWYVEYLTYRMDPATSTPRWTCHALRLRGDRLESLTWDTHSTPDPTKFSVLMSGVTATDADAGPFPPPEAVNGGKDLQRLRIALTTVAGKYSTSASGSFDVTFTALNSSSTTKENDPPDTQAATVCTQERQP